MINVLRHSNDSDRNINASLYFSNIDYQVTELLLYELFIQFGPIRTLNLPKDRILKTHQGYGFVEFKTAKDAEYVLEILRGIRLFGKVLKLKKVDPHFKTNLSASAGHLITQTTPMSGIDVGAKLFIKNLHPLVDEKMLRDTFSRFGNIIRPPVVARDPDSNASKGYGFITYDDFAASDLAIEKMNGVILTNNKISVSYAYKDELVGSSNKRARHGDKAERLLAENAKKNNMVPQKRSSPNATLSQSKHSKKKK